MNFDLANKSSWARSLAPLLALAACTPSDDAGLEPDILAEVQEKLEAEYMIARSLHFHPDSGWWHTTDTVPMDIDGQEKHLRRIAAEQYGLTRAQVDEVVDRLRAAKRQRTGDRGTEVNIVREFVEFDPDKHSEARAEMEARSRRMMEALRKGRIK